MFYQNGKCLSPPIFNRASIIITEDYKVYLERVKITELIIHNEKINWQKENHKCEEDEVGYYSSLWGFETPIEENHTHISIVGTTIVGIQPNGGMSIPFTGFIVSIPNSHNVLRFIKVGDEVKIENSFNKGKILEAMACGPLLLKDGEIEVNFNLEEFGRKDSSVMSFFLPRLFESYEAARSFIGISKDNKITLGTVSGRFFGGGNNSEPCGVTFGELAFLAKDLGFSQAMGLDGGGSSSLVVKEDDEVKIINVPTGGSDVPRGHERFISTGLLIYPKKK